MKISTKDELMKLLNEVSEIVDAMKMGTSSKAIESFKHLSGMMLYDIGSYVFKNWSCYNYLYHMFEVFHLISKGEYLFLGLHIKQDVMLWECMLKHPEILKFTYMKLEILFENHCDTLTKEKRIVVEHIMEEITHLIERNDWSHLKVKSPSSDNNYVEEMYAFFNERVIGHEKIKKSLACKVQQLLDDGKPRPILLIGSSGHGKSYLLSVLKEFSIMKKLKLTVMYQDASRITQNGFSGKNFTDVLSEIKDAKRNSDKVVMFLDEFDKMVMPSYDSGNQNVSIRVLGQLLTALEATDETCENVLFILGGAFSSIDEEKQRSNQIGFLKEEKVSFINESLSIKEKLLEFGCNPEFIARVDCCQMDHLTVSDFSKILHLPTGGVSKVIEKYRKLGVDIILTEEFKRQLVHGAFKLGLGARSIMSIFQNICDQYGVEYEIYTRNDLRKIIFNENALQGYPPVFVGEDDKILECSMVH